MLTVIGNLRKMKTIGLKRIEIEELIREKHSLLKSNNGDKKLLSELYFLIARIHLDNNNIKLSREFFGKCNSLLIENCLPESLELYFWMGIILEKETKLYQALGIYRTIQNKLTDETNYLEEYINLKISKIQN